MATDWRTVSGTDEGGRISRALASERRRLVLTVLAGTETPVSLVDLAGLVAGRERGRRGGRIDDRVEAVHVALYHRDVPKLDDAGLVDWDRDRGVVEPGLAFQDALPVLEAIIDA